MKKRVLALVCMLAVLLAASVFGVAAEENGAVIDSTGYATLQMALENYEAGKIIQLQANVTGEVTISQDVYLDLNGFNIPSVSVDTGKTLYCMDSKTETFSGEGFGVISAYSGKVTGLAADNHPRLYSTLPVPDGTSVSFHAVDLMITSMTLRPKDGAQNTPSVYFTSAFKGDSYVKNQIISYGTALSIAATPNADNLESKCKYTTFEGANFVAGDVNTNAANGTLLTGIMKPGNSSDVNLYNATKPVYGCSYIKVGSGYVFGPSVSLSLQDHAEEVNSNWEYYDTDKKAAYIGMYEDYSSVLKQWDLNNIKDPAQDGILKVLVLGNSHGLDSTNLLYEVFKDQQPGMRVVLGAMYHEGCRMEEHARFAKENLPYYDYYKIDSANTNGNWIINEGRGYGAGQDSGLIKDGVVVGTTIKQALQDEQWDIIVMQQMSNRSALDAQYGADSSYIKNDYKAVINYIYKHQIGTPKLAFNMVMPTPDSQDFIGGTYSNKNQVFTPNDANHGTSNPAWLYNHQRWFGVHADGTKCNCGYQWCVESSFKSINMWKEMARCMQTHIVDSTNFLGKDYYEFVIPVGTAIQYARDELGYTDDATGYEGATAKYSLGALYRDYTHLGDYGRLIAAYTWYGYIMRYWTGNEDFRIETVGVEGIPASLHHTKSTYPAASTNAYANCDYETNYAYEFTVKMREDVKTTVNYVLANPFTLPEAE